ncbi:MAG TPA: phosphoribosylanthranilate isomerase [Oligoflexia bacterium]|nr:phosphoribosylanthranilate isomerase [Oligoflexia bacterium]HMP48180.1 phosphoribosylanthranilate isomerase [Oligoflexia bacterium]
MKPLIKVCGNTRLDNISSLVKEPFVPDYLGFIACKGSKRIVDFRVLEEFICAAPSRIKTALVFCGNELSDLQGVTCLSGISAIQFHNNQSAKFMKDCRKVFVGEFIKVFSVSDDFDFSSCLEFEEVSDFFLFDTGISGTKISGGTGSTFNWDRLKDYKSTRPYFLAGGIGPDDVTRIKNLAKEQVMLLGIDINSRFETAPGLKDTELVKRFIEEIRR